MTRKTYIAPAIEVVSMMTECMLAGSNSSTGESKFRRMPFDNSKTIRDSRKIFSRDLGESSDFWVNEDEGEDF